MVAWISTPAGRRQTAARGLLIVLVGGALCFAGTFRWHFLVWPGVAVVLLGAYIVAWAFLHKTISGLPARSDWHDDYARDESEGRARDFSDEPPPAPRRRLSTISGLLNNWAQIDQHQGAPIIAVTFAGVYPPGSDGNDFADAMASFLNNIVAAEGPAAVVIDLTSLEYVHGDAIGQLAMELARGGTKSFLPSAVVATGPTAVALQRLLGPEFIMGIAGMKLVPTREEGLALVKLALQKREKR